ncbi:MAG: hypothetical protein CM1200mP1_14650 [Candidatus Neomarinimicrobiota bacterium]|nr:MAG: hypothetical protein CM1200mP1_14650 [Candidatus Neomarinimicrobiota bacterium]
MSTFNQSQVYLYSKNQKNNRFELGEIITNNDYKKIDHFGRNITLLDNALITDAYYADENYFIQRYECKSIFYTKSFNKRGSCINQE